MTHLTKNRAILGPLPRAHSGITTADNLTPWPVVSVWQWLLAISEVAVKHGYASPWEEADRCLVMDATGKR